MNTAGDTIRVTRKERRCDDCRRPIAAGERYLRRTEPPGAGLINWCTTCHCAQCAAVDIEARA